MTNLPTLHDSTSRIKSFWERPEGTTGMVTIAVIALGVFFVGQAVLPAIISLLGLAITAVGKTIVLVVLVALLAGLLYVLTNNRFQTLVGFMFKSAMRKVTSLFVETDPIGIMKSYIDTLRDKKTKFDENKSSLRGQIRACQNQIDANNEEIKRATSLARAAQKNSNQGQLAVHGRNMERLSALNQRMTGTLNKMEMLYKFLGKYSDATDLVIQDMTNDVKAREQERKYSTTANSAMRSAMAILKGEGAGKELYDEAMEYALADYANKMGEIEDFMDSTQTIMEGIDLQNGVWEQAALEKLNQFEAQTSSLVLGGEKRLMLENTISAEVPMYEPLDSMPVNLGEAAAALEVLNRAYATRSDPEIAAHLGEVLWSLGRKDEARATWEKARAEHPANETSSQHDYARYFSTNK